MLEEFVPLSDLIRQHAAARPAQMALAQADQTLSYQQLDQLMDRVAASLQRDGLAPGQTIALSGRSTPLQAAVFLGALRAGLTVAPLSASVTAPVFAAMLKDAQAQKLFVDAQALPLVPPELARHALQLDGEPGAATSLQDWLAPGSVSPRPVLPDPQAPFNIIYSSGTTGVPKGIVQSHGMRHMHIRRGERYAYDIGSVTLLSTPLYSNTTLVVFFPSLAYGASVLLMDKFDATQWLALADQWRVSHTMLVPVQYQRLLAHPQFDAHDLSAFKVKFCTSAPFSAQLKADALRRWSGALVEFYGMTEGGGTCILEAHLHPDKLHTVGRPADGHDIRLIDDEGRELPPDQPGEVVGHSPAMMSGYHGQPDKTREAEWFSPDGKRFIRTGDVGRFDADGFLVLLDRKKDLIISGGFNIYPSDLEAQLRQHPAVADVAVVGVPSEQWGETPVAWVVPKAGDPIDPQALRQWLNQSVGKTQRLSALRFVPELPRSAIGKVLKRELRDQWVQSQSGE